MTAPVAMPVWRPAKPPARSWDVVVTVLLLVVVAAEALVASYSGLLVGMLADPCGGTAQCDFGAVNAGMLTAIAAPWVILLATIAVSIVLLVKRRLAFWVPIAAVVLIPAAWYLGVAIAEAGVRR